MTHPGRVLIATDAAAALLPAESEIGRAIRAAVDARGVCHLALAGGNTPLPLYRALRETDVPWRQVHVYFGDERCVPPNDPDSNFRAAHEALLARVPAAAVYRMRGEDADRDAAAAHYAALLPEALDVLLLGLGPDGHTLSLFPGAAEPPGQVAVVHGPKPPPWRLTLTPAVVRAARSRFVLAFGADKAAALARAVQGKWDPEHTPAQWARPAVWLVDQAAAKRLDMGF